ncbi:MAG: hypothetical protein RI907_1347 [Pseudomonadota bacterium]|jgi:multidrug efflux pump subunit AcrA (membrane-fusion protein)
MPALPTRALPLALLAGACLAHAAGAPLTVSLTPAQRERLGVQTVALSPAAESGRVVLQGQVVQPAHLQRVLSAPVAALVEQVQVNQGDAVKSGQALLALNAPQVVEWQRDLQQATLAARLAQQAAQRDADLLAEGIVPASRAQTSQAQWQMAQATLNERTQQLKLAGVRPQAQGPLSGQLTVAAPARGTVVEVMAQVGQRVEAGAPLLKFAVDGPLDIVMQAPQDVARRLNPGDAVRVAGCDTPARLHSVNAQLEGASQMVAVRARWPQPQRCVWPQQRVEAEVLLQTQAASGQQPGWRLPAASVLTREGQSLVFVQGQAGHYTAVPVTVVAEQAGQAGQAGTVLVRPRQAGALKAGDAVVSRGAVALKGVLQGLGAE